MLRASREGKALQLCSQKEVCSFPVTGPISGEEYHGGEGQDSQSLPPYYSFPPRISGGASTGSKAPVLRTTFTAVIQPRQHHPPTETKVFLESPRGVRVCPSVSEPPSKCHLSVALGGITFISLFCSLLRVTF